MMPQALHNIILEPRQHALFLDIDGTLLDFAATPELVTVPVGLLDNLNVLHAALGGALALISGRTLESIDILFPAPFAAAGAHGAQWRSDHGERSLPLLPPILGQNVKNSFSNQHAIRVEDKGQALAVHYRGVPGVRSQVLATMRQILTAGADSHPAPLRLIDGHLVAEIAYAEADKCRALHHFLTHRPFRGKRPIFLGDDTTDLAAIAAAQKLGGHGLRVGDAVGMPPDQVRAWIGRESARLAGH